MLDKGMKLRPLPTVKFINDNRENAKDFFGKTAYYDPNTQTIVLYTEGRHPKDIVRSFAHEMVHHTQNLEGRIGNIQTTDTTSDEDLDAIEREAYLNGNMIFRNWTDSALPSLHWRPFWPFAHQADQTPLLFLEHPFLCPALIFQQKLFLVDPLR